MSNTKPVKEETNNPDAPSSPTDDLQEFAEKLYEDVKFQFKADKLDVSNTFTLVRIAMETVEKYKGLAGRQKKELVIRVLHKALEDLVLDETDSEALNIFVDKMVDIVIDNFVDINFGNLKINKDCHSKLKKVFPCMYKQQ